MSLLKLFEQVTDAADQVARASLVHDMVGTIRADPSLLDVFAAGPENHGLVEPVGTQVPDKVPTGQVRAHIHVGQQ